MYSIRDVILSKPPIYTPNSALNTSSRLLARTLLRDARESLERDRLHGEERGEENEQGESQVRASTGFLLRLRRGRFLGRGRLGVRLLRRAEGRQRNGRRAEARQGRRADGRRLRHRRRRELLRLLRRSRRGLGLLLGEQIARERLCVALGDLSHLDRGVRQRARHDRHREHRRARLFLSVRANDRGVAAFRLVLSRGRARGHRRGRGDSSDHVDGYLVVSASVCVVERRASRGFARRKVFRAFVRGASRRTVR